MLQSLYKVREGCCVAQVMIFDFDVHHGNGTNDIFYGDKDVLFVSTHQQGSYPGTGKLSEVGKGDGEGTSINLPLPGVQLDLLNALRHTLSCSMLEQQFVDA